MCPPIGNLAFGVPSISETLNTKALTPQGESYEATVPDTLELIDRANLSINGLTGNVESATYYGVYQGFSFTKAPVRYHALTWNITPKNARTLPELRTITGSDKNLDVDVGMMRALLSEIEDDGYMYYPFDGSGPPKGTSYPQINALTMFAMLNYHARDNNPLWLEWIDLLGKGLQKSAIQVENRAYYPMQSGIDKQGEWHFMNHEGDMPMPYTPPDEPKSDAEGLEGAAKSDTNRCMSALVLHSRLTGDEKSMEIAKKLSRFVMKPELWETIDVPGMDSSQQGFWSGHFHNGTQGLLAILDFAVATDNEDLKQVVRQAYDCARLNGVIRIGWFPAWSKPWLYNRPNSLELLTEPCALGDMICLGVMMSDAGLGDYYDDVESILRNTLQAQQLIDMEKLRKVSGTKKGSEGDSLLKRFLGGFSGGGVCSLGGNDLAGCCTANGAQGIYYAWHGITRYNDGVATVNMFLNRASPWMDIDSYIPYEGKVVLHNKTAHTAMVRVPGWVDKEQVRAFQNDKEIDPPLSGNHLLIVGLAPKDEIRIEFPITESTSEYTIHGDKYTVEFKGNQAINITPDENPENYYSYYPLDKYRADKAPMRKVTRFVAESVIPLGTY